MVKKKEEVRTTLRLPKQLHSKLHDEIRRRGCTAESLIEEAIARELERLEFTQQLEAATGWGPVLAQRLLLVAPTPIVIKEVRSVSGNSNFEPRIAWANFAYEDLFGFDSSAELMGRTLSELTVVDAEAERMIEQDVERVLAQGPQEFLEGITIKVRRGASSQRRLLFRTHRFLFTHGGFDFIGDISFDWSELLPGDHDASDQRGRLFKNPLVGEMGELLTRFVEDSPSSIAVKDGSGKIVYCNRVYRDLAPKEKGDPIGQSARDLWNLPAHHPVYVNDARVAKMGIWMYAKEELGGRTRTSLRFPIPGPDGTTAFTGVISANFRLQEEYCQRVQD